MKNIFRTKKNDSDSESNSDAQRSNISDEASDINTSNEYIDPEVKLPKKFTSDSTSVQDTSKKMHKNPINLKISDIPPELVPIVRLFAAHTHRRYHEGIFLMLHDVSSDGVPKSTKWKETFGVLLGSQLALWDANKLGKSTSLKNITQRPTYINFTDAKVVPLDPVSGALAEDRKKMQNTLVVSTGLKNRYFLQFKKKQSFNTWHAALRLSQYESTALQEAYTGAFLASKGMQLGDIKVVLANTKFDYKDWVSIRLGVGLPWLRYYAVISQSTKKGKAYGRITLFENDKKVKKKDIVATIISTKSLYAVYPSSPALIDSSTLIRLEGNIQFGKDGEPEERSIFIMPEKHNAVPGYDTIIRFLFPVMNAFKLYGRPHKLIPDKSDDKSLFFGLPASPHVYYLSVKDLLPSTNSANSSSWTSSDWQGEIKQILSSKMAAGYTGDGSLSNLPKDLFSSAFGSDGLYFGPQKSTKMDVLAKPSMKLIRKSMKRYKIPDSPTEPPLPEPIKDSQPEDINDLTDPSRNRSTKSGVLSEIYSKYSNSPFGDSEVRSSSLSSTVNYTPHSAEFNSSANNLSRRELYMNAADSSSNDSIQEDGGYIDNPSPVSNEIENVQKNKKDSLPPSYSSEFDGKDIPTPIAEIYAAQKAIEENTPDLSNEKATYQPYEQKGLSIANINEFQDFSNNNNLRNKKPTNIYTIEGMRPNPNVPIVDSKVVNNKNNMQPTNIEQPQDRSVSGGQMPAARPNNRQITPNNQMMDQQVAPNNSIPMSQNQMPMSQNQMSMPSNQMRPQNQMGMMGNQMRTQRQGGMMGNQMNSQNQAGMMGNQMRPQNQMGMMGNQMRPQNQMGMMGNQMRPNNNRMMMSSQMMMGNQMRPNNQMNMMGGQMRTNNGPMMHPNQQGRPYPMNNGRPNNRPMNHINNGQNQYQARNNYSQFMPQSQNQTAYPYA